jgi:hypothetical protein
MILRSARIQFIVTSVSTQVRVVYQHTSFPLNPRRVASTRALYESLTGAHLIRRYLSNQGRGVFGSFYDHQIIKESHWRAVLPLSSSSAVGVQKPASPLTRRWGD